MKLFTVIFLLCCVAVAKGTKRTSSRKGAGSSSGSSASSVSRANLKAHVDCFFQGEKHVKFFLYTHHDLNNPIELKFNSKIDSKWVNKEWKTIVFIHGWIGGHRFAEIMKNAYLGANVHEVNLIEIDWLRGANHPLYCPSAKRVPNVGETVAKFIGLNLEKFNSEKIIIVGHSLGAHAAGFTGKFLQRNYNFKPPLIVGLDPAGPSFRSNTGKLHPDDANNVLVIHTSQKFGHLEPLGTIDVYINGGKIQNGCTDAQSHGFSKLFYTELANGMVPIVGHKYSSFADVVNDVIPSNEEVKLFHGLPFPPRGTLIYVSTGEQLHLISEVKEYIDSKVNPDITECCTIM